MWISLWLFCGIISMVLAIYIFRRNGESKKGELYGASLGAILGPIILCLILIDGMRKKK